ncbi:uracil-DNA glycosylase [Acidisoma sp.]|uniref:uracil-DNA glycosylase n=1 Tax=Acidisoma sp. TaxID=1872115 RepID=UPI003B005117
MGMQNAMSTESLTAAAVDPATPTPDCPLCPRLVEYRHANRAANPDWFNAPVPSFGPIDAPVVVIGMAPGVRGANRTGRPFTGDHAGLLLYKTLIEFGLAQGTYEARPDDGLVLTGCRIVNAVRCVPPANLPTPAETKTCNRFLTKELQRMPNLRVALALGVLAHAAVLKACGIPQSHVRFRHGAIHELPDGLLLCDSYHVSRYNTNTGRLTDAMFNAVMREVCARAQEPAA